VIIQCCLEVYFEVIVNEKHSKDRSLGLFKESMLRKTNLHKTRLPLCLSEIVVKC
jgi:hypothetical protein